MPSNRLKTKEVTVRDEQFKIREWTTEERSKFLKMSQEDALLAVAYLAHRCTLKDDGSSEWPKENQAREEPPELIDGLVKEITELSGLKMETEEDKAKND